MGASSAVPGGNRGIRPVSGRHVVLDEQALPFAEFGWRLWLPSQRGSSLWASWG